MRNVQLYSNIVKQLETAGADTPYAADANEPDPRYLGYGVRAPAMKTLIAGLQPQFKQLDDKAKIELALTLIASGYGEQKTIALHLLEKSLAYFVPSNLPVIDEIMRSLHGWSKVDAYTGRFLGSILTSHPTEILEFVNRWNRDDDMWLRRASVVLFTRKVARSGNYTSQALTLCENLKQDTEDLVRKGVGWCLKDLMHADKNRILDYVIELREQGVSSTVTLYALRDIKGQERKKILARVG